LRVLVRLVGLVAVAGVTVGCPGMARVGAAGDGEVSPDELLERAREAAQAERFTGEVEVEWRDGRNRRRARVPVESAGGVLRVGDGVVGTGFQRMVRGSKGWLMLWSHEVASAGPSPRGKYSFSVLLGPSVATRPTRLVEVRLASANRLRERLYLDRHTGLLLRREMLDARGEPYRSVGYLTIAPSEAAAPATPRPRTLEPVSTGDLPAPYRAPRRLGDGYQLMGAYKKRGAVHLFYSDGLHGLSVFEQRGRLGPWIRGGRDVELMGRTVRAYSTATGEAAVWEGDGLVYTVVSDGPWQDLASAARALPHKERGGRLQKVAEVVVSLFRWK
jgi:MucB/RseB family protein